MTINNLLIDSIKTCIALIDAGHDAAMVLEFLTEMPACDTKDWLSRTLIGADRAKLFSIKKYLMQDLEELYLSQPHESWEY